MPKVKLIDLKQVDSTNDYLKANYKKLTPFTFVKADYQKKGRGQFDRRWQSNSGRNLLFSFILKKIDFSQITLIKEWVKSSLFEVLGKYGLDPYYKEPNDIYINDKKLCGILIETLSNDKQFEYVIIGIGLNVNQTLFPLLNATSIYKETKKKVKINELYSLIINSLIDNYF